MKKNRLVSVGFIVLAVIWVMHFATNHFRQFGAIAGHTTRSTVGPPSLVRSLRPSYPYSIIPGGAYSPQELLFAHGKDTVVRAHYADFDVSHARVVRLTDDRYQYVSYRMKDQVFWTKKKLKIPSGELLLTDGAQYARARCGNRLSDQPHKAVSVHEPDQALLSLPPVTLDLLPKLALADPPAARSVPGAPLAVPLPAVPAIAPGVAADQPLVPLVPVWGGQPFVPGMPAGGGGYTSATPSKPATGTTVTPTSPNKPGDPEVPAPALVPEPSTIYLFLITLLFSGWVMLRSKPTPGDPNHNPNQGLTPGDSNQPH